LFAVQTLFIPNIATDIAPCHGQITHIKNDKILFTLGTENSYLSAKKFATDVFY
jgi:hypothetical protein